MASLLLPTVVGHGDTHCLFTKQGLVSVHLRTLPTLSYFQATAMTREPEQNVFRPSFLHFLRRLLLKK